MSSSPSMQGVCTHFCPSAESRMRIKEKLLHYYELESGDLSKPGILVKCFSRSAAGTKAAKPNDLRTEQCLQETVEYLLQHILLDERKSFKMRYDFIFDRLRAVRQDIVVQDFKEAATIKLLEPIIMFLAYSRYRLCEESINNFDPKICEQHLQECLKRVLYCYDQVDDVHKEMLKNRCFFESLYQLFNIGSVQTLHRALQLPATVRQQAQFDLCFQLALSLQHNHLYRIFRAMQNLPHILCAVLSLKLPVFRFRLLQMFASAYNSKQLTVPIEYVQNLSNYASAQTLLEDCKHFGLKLNAEKTGIYFQKVDFKQDVPIKQTKHEHFVEEKFQEIQLSKVLLLVKL